MWTKKSRKGKHEQEKAYVESKKRHQKLKTHVKTRFANKVIMFEELWEVENTKILGDC